MLKIPSKLHCIITTLTVLFIFHIINIYLGYHGLICANNITYIEAGQTVVKNYVCNCTNILLGCSNILYLLPKLSVLLIITNGIDLIFSVYLLLAFACYLFGKCNKEDKTNFYQKLMVICSVTIIIILSIFIGAALLWNLIYYKVDSIIYYLNAGTIFSGIPIIYISWKLLSIIKYGYLEDYTRLN